VSSETPTTAIQPKRRIALWGWPLIAIRLLALLVLLFVCVSAYYLLAPFTARNPVPRQFLKLVGAISGLRVATEGARPAQNTFFLANHLSWLDIPALSGAAGTAFIAHDGLAGFGPMRWLCALNDTVFIARHRRSTVAAQVEQVRKALSETGALAIFPEGTTSNGKELLPFKSSLLSAIGTEDSSLAVQPVWLDYGKEAAEIAWVGEEPGVDNALRILARVKPLRMTLHFLPPLAGEDRRDRKAMARGAQQAIEEASRKE
jgi:1-acyl-sn-glycerol-3-phosphate acyltransferase